MRNRIMRSLALLVLVSMLAAILASCDITLPDIDTPDSDTNGESSDNIGNGNENSGTNGNENGDSNTDTDGDGGNTDTDTDGDGESDTDTGGGMDDEPMPHTHDWTSNPYTGISKTEFYDNYSPACCYLDATYRTELYLMSGDISEQDQAPTRAEKILTNGGKNVKNTSHLYSDDGNTYYVTDADGAIVGAVYRGAAYVTLEDVAAYVYAFGNVPANYLSKKSASPASSDWGIYLRLNHSKFSGNTAKYPYEPELPRISGCGGDLDYYEIDIGTTGTDCDPGYAALPYNNGSRITRGAARIVYARFTSFGSSVVDTDNERFVFYTYNHYNDFEEYLNYRGGWGEMFGNITGGGAISSKTNYNPTPYVTVVLMPIASGKEN